jgi:hypothetical protein
VRENFIGRGDTVARVMDRSARAVMAVIALAKLGAVSPPDRDAPADFGQCLLSRGPRDAAPRTW